MDIITIICLIIIFLFSATALIISIKGLINNREKFDYDYDCISRCQATACSDPDASPNCKINCIRVCKGLPSYNTGLNYNINKGVF